MADVQNIKLEKVQIKRGLSATWDAQGDSIDLAAGEFAYAKDTNVLKVGNGTDHWKDLPAVGSNAALPTLNITIDGGDLDASPNA